MSQKDEIYNYFLQAAGVSRKSWKRGEFLCYEGGTIEHLHNLLSGKFRVFRSLNNGREMLYRIYLPGSVIGDIEVFTASGTASCSVQCIEDALTLALPMSGLRENPASAAGLIFALGGGIARKLHENSVSEALNTAYPLEVRLAHYYLTFTDPDLQAQNLGQLAGWMGCSYRHLTRSLAKLRNCGAIGKTGPVYEAADKRILESIAAPLIMEDQGRILFEPGN